MGKGGSAAGGGQERGFVNRPLQSLSSLKDRLAPADAHGAAQPPPGPQASPPPPVESEERAFEQAMDGVVPLAGRERVARRRATFGGGRTQ